MFFDQCNKASDCFVDIQCRGNHLGRLTVCHNVTYNGDFEIRCDKLIQSGFVEEVHYNGTFALVFTNSTSFTQRLYDALRFGSIPVVVGTDAYMPFSEYLDWTPAVLTIPRRNLPVLLSLLRSIPKKTVYRLRKAGRYFLENYVGNSKGKDQP